MEKRLGVMLASVIAAIVLTLTACGGKEESNTNGAQPVDEANAKVITISASNYQFNQAEYRVKAGETVKFVFENKEGFHGVAIKGLDVDLNKTNPEKTVTLKEPGTYEMFCTIQCGAGHADMRAKLIVE